jgi:crotonobetainyl-CoA:carnitine CoA-transferase CaiB-like acyl-CoA transferase
MPASNTGTGDSTATLDGLRVLDVGMRPSTAWCGRLLADLGADVIGAEPAGGHPLRRDPPAAAYFLANRRRADLAAVPDLAAAADVIVTSESSPETSVAALRGHCDRALIACVTAYGRGAALAGSGPAGSGPAGSGPAGSGPAGSGPAGSGNDLTAYATSGWASVNGLAARAPLKGPGYNASFQSGTFAWAAVTAALLGEPAGEVLDIAERDVLCSTLSPAFLRQQYTGNPERRREAADITAGPVPVADGYFALTMSRPHFWQNAMRVLGLDDLAEVPELQTSASRARRKDQWAGRVQQAMLGWKRADLFDALAARRVIAGPVLDVADLASNAQLTAREFFRGPDEAPGAPRQAGPAVRYGRTRWRLARPAPEQHAPGQPGATRFTGAGLSVSRRARAAKAGAGPLSGYRGLVLTQAWAGTYTTELLALLGADIVQVENRGRLDSWRGSDSGTVSAVLAGHETTGAAYDLNPLFNSVNLGKRSITLDLAAPEGRDLFRRLVPRFDFVAENFSPRVMGNLGIGYADLCQLRPGIVLVSMSAYGATGPWSPVPGIGGTIEPSSGMSALLGYPGGPPLNSGHMYPDPVAGLYGLGAVATALAHRRRTGEGQYVDLSMQEACATFVGEEWLRYAETGVVPARRGNRHPAYAPHGVFRCAGEDQWVALAAPDDASFAAVARVLGADDSAPGDAELAGAWFATAAGRLAHEDELEAAITRQTTKRDKRELAESLTSAGAIAAPVLDVGEVLADPGPADRGVLRPVTHSLAGPAVQAGLPLRMANTPLPPWAPAPLHGEHSLEVLQQELGLGQREYAALVRAGITGCGPVKES